VRRTRGWWGALVVVAACTIAGCASSGDLTGGTGSPSPSRSATTTTMATAGPRTIESRDVASVLRGLGLANPTVLPVAVPIDWKVELSVTGGAYAIRYTSPVGGRSVTLQIAIANPPLPGARTEQSDNPFRGDPHGHYQAIDTADPGTHRSLQWTEPGIWIGQPAAGPGVPYYLTSEGISHAGFWSIAHSLVTVATAESRDRPTSLGAFAGAWHVHTNQLQVDGDTAVATYPVHVWCPAPVPCDHFEGNNIIVAGHVTIHLEGVDDAGIAHGTVVATTDVDGFDLGPVILMRTPGDHLVVAGVGGPPWGDLCGPASPTNTCGA
jgi:hypothetical protein